MDVRDATEADAERLAALADVPESATTALVHDRSVRVCADGEEIRGFVAYDARPGAVHVTSLGGDRDAIVRLLAEPTRFAAKEGMDVEAVVPVNESETAAALAAADFEETGEGPSFGGERTIRYRKAPE